MKRQTLSELTEGLVLPDGMHFCSWHNNNVGIVTPHAYATIDFDARGFRSGLTITGRNINKAPFGGRGWRQKLVDAAVAWLESIR